MRARRLFAFLVVVPTLIAVVAVPPALANHKPAFGGFEVDGDNDDDPEAGIDWETTPFPSDIARVDFADATGRGDSIFKRGSKELVQDTWQCDTGSAPGKDDIVSGSIGFREVGDSQFMIVRFVRAGVNGDAHMDWEFNQFSPAEAPASANCPQLSRRATGDSVITFDTENGGATIIVRAFRWDDAIATFVQLPLGSQGTSWEGAVNIPNAEPHRIQGLQAGAFGEAALNLDETIGDFDCGEFASVFMKTRSATSINSDLKDRTTSEPLNVGRCPASELDKAVRNETTDGPFSTSTEASPGDVIEYRLTYRNAGTGDATDVIVTEEVPDHSTFLDCTAGCATTGTTPGSGIEWSLGTVAAGGEVVVTFRVQLDASFPSGETPISNVATVDTAEEEPVDSNEASVIVSASPGSELHKEARNETEGGTFGPGVSDAEPSDVIEYRFTYHNHGDAPASDVTIDEEVPDHSTFLDCTGGCTTTGTTPGSGIEWTLGTVAAGGEVVVTFRVQLDAGFPSGETTISNVGTVDTAEEPPEDSNPVDVVVTAAPDLQLAKSADVTEVTVGGEITYTLSFSNDGNGDATDVVISEPIPDHTEFVSCTGGCTVAGGTATWDIGTVAAGAGGSVSLTVRVTDDIGCVICNVASISSPDQDDGAGIPSNEVCVTITPVADPAGANAHDSAFGARVVDTQLAIDETLTPVSSSQSGVGSDTANDDLLTVNVPDPTGEILRATALRTSSTSTVGDAPAEATHASVAEAVGVNVLNGAVTAGLVRGVARAVATGSSAGFDSLGSTFENLVVDGTAMEDVTPNTRVDLPPDVYGPGSYVILFERIGSVGVPPDGTTSGGTYAADLAVNMIRVHVTDRLPVVAGDQTVDVTVSDAVAHADFPQTTLCETAPTQAVFGHAFIASETTTDPNLVATLVGLTSVPVTGGHDHQDLLEFALPDDGTAVRGGASVSDTAGSLAPGSSTATAFARAEEVCALEMAGVCTVAADLIHSQANADAGAGGASATDDGTLFVGVTVNGVSEEIDAPNETITLDGLGFVVFNEQTCDDAGTLAADCSDGAVAGHAGRTVRAIRIVITVPGNPLGLQPGAEIVVAEAHAGATFA